MDKRYEFEGLAFFHFKHDRKRLLSDIGLTNSDRKCVVNYSSTPLRRENGRLLLR